MSFSPAKSDFEELPLPSLCRCLLVWTHCLPHRFHSFRRPSLSRSNRSPPHCEFHLLHSLWPLLLHCSRPPTHKFIRYPSGWVLVRDEMPYVVQKVTYLYSPCVPPFTRWVLATIQFAPFLCSLPLGFEVSQLNHFFSATSISTTKVCLKTVLRFQKTFSPSLSFSI